MLKTPFSTLKRVDSPPQEVYNGSVENVIVSWTSRVRVKPTKTRGETTKGERIGKAIFFRSSLVETREGEWNPPRRGENVLMPGLISGSFVVFNLNNAA